MDALLTVFWGVVVLLILVFVHELGHFIVARLCGARVTEFMIGMPGPNIGFERNGCRYGITCIPLGGYNRITGMEGGPEDENLEIVLSHVMRQGTTDVEHTALACNISEDDAEFALTVLDGWGSINKPGRSNKLDKWAAPKTAEHALGEPREVEDPAALLDAEREQTYRGCNFPQRLAILFAGPLMNVLLALVIFLGMFCIMGLPYASNVVDCVTDGSPAATAGIEPGDAIVKANDTEVETLSDLRGALSEVQVGDDVTITYQRDGKDAQVVMTVVAGDDGATPMIGIVARTERMRLSVGDALLSTWSMLRLTVEAYANLINPSTAAETLSQSSSIVGISVMAKQAADAGLFNLLYLIAIVSLSLAVVNLLPVPPLDGGKILVEIIEVIARRPVPVRIINAITIVVIALLVVLFVVLLRQDIINFIL